MAKRRGATFTDSIGRVRKASRASWGTIRMLPSGRYQASFVGPDELRHPAPVTFDAKVDADAWLTAQRAAIIAGTWTPRAVTQVHDMQAERSQTFGDYARGWIATRISPRTGRPLSPTTKAEYERKLDSDDFKPLTREPIAALARKDLERWYHGIADSGRLTTAARAYQFVHGVLETAAKDGVIAENPANIPGASTATSGKDVQMPTDAELLIIEASMPAEWRAMATISAWGGTRYGETTELRRKDVLIDDDRVVISVERAVTYVKGRFVVGSTKSKAGKRKVILAGPDAKVVTNHLARFVSSSPDALLFPHPRRQAGPTDLKGPHLMQSYHYRVWDGIRKAAGRPDMPWHALRHHFGTKVAAAGGTVADVQAALGDSSASAALRYVDTAAERLSEIAERMSKRT